jgi:hypothetical protein
MTKSDIIDYLKNKSEIRHKVFIMEIIFFIEKDNKEYKFMVVRRNEKLVSLFNTNLKITLLKPKELTPTILDNYIEQFMLSVKKEQTKQRIKDLKEDFN